MHRPTHPATRGQIALALGSLYLLWGSTYLAIRIAVETVPPFLMTGSRFLVAGIVLYAIARWRGEPKPEWKHWKAATAVGALLLLVGNGGVCWSEQYIPSGLAALLVATTPLWMVLFDWWGFGGLRPTWQIAVGLGVGIVGAAILVAPGSLAGGGHVDSMGAAAVVIGTISWALGSLYARRATLPASPWLATAMEMITGGVLLLIASALLGEWRGLDVAHMSQRSLGALVYLCIFGSLLGFSSYAWLLRTTSTAVASTYAYVNPLVAVTLGALLGGEQITTRTLLAGAAILAAVVIIISQPKGAEEVTEPV